MTQTRPPHPDFDILIVGAGPAGMFCAEQMLDLGVAPDRICALDAGKPMASRSCPPPQPYCATTDCSHDCDILHGEGGPGLYLDCKLCIDPAAGAKHALKSVPDYPELIEKLDRRAYEILRQSSFEAQRQNPGKRNIAFYRRYFNRFGLSYHAYPVRTLGTDGAQLLARRLSLILASKGLSIKYRHRLIDLRLADDVFHVEVTNGVNKLTLSTRIVVLALGRAGTPFIEEFARRHSLQLFPNALDIGVRLEFPLWSGLDLLGTGANPKIKALMPTNQYAKTHCFCHGGEVISYRYQGIHLVDGHAFHKHPGPNSNINLLYRYRLPDSIDASQFFRDSMSVVNNAADGKIVAQRLGALLGTPRIGSELEPTLPADRFIWGDVSKLLPSEVVDAIRELVTRLGEAVPGMSDSGNIVYAPAAEWTMKRLQISNTMESSIAGLYVVGDCAGVSQGVLAAAAAGIIAGAAIASRPELSLIR